MKLDYLFATLLSVLAINLFAQNTVISGSQEYQKLKEEGKLTPEMIGAYILPQEDFSNIKPQENRGANRNAGCGCYEEPDGTYTLAMGPNDDGSTAAIPMPFSFCLYGDIYTSFYINNNGNVTFVSPYGTFSSVPFPSATYRMLAPFWADVDTRGVGQVWYKVTPTAVYVSWVNVGYYNMQTDKTNTFQVIFTNGSDPVIGVGNNVAFCYGDMQWTTGSASSGVNGFGGTPATVGANRGNGVDFVQFGRFDQPGTAYDGPFGANDGVDWLDNQTFVFDACVVGSNIAPIATASYTINGAPAQGNGTCDEFTMCVGDILEIEINFLSPENGQTTTVTTNTIPNFNTTINTPGNPASFSAIFAPQNINYGQNIITITGTDNGTPPMSYTVSLVIDVDTLSVPPPVITGPDSVCVGQPYTLTAGSGFDNYLWNGGQTDSVLNLTGAGTYVVWGYLNGCAAKSDTLIVVTVPNPTPQITGNNTICDGLTTTLSVTQPYSSYSWNTGETTNQITVSQSGTYSLIVTNSIGCVGSASINVSVYNINVTGPAQVCGNQAQLQAQNSFGGSWSSPTSSGGTVTFSPVNTATNPTVSVGGEGLYNFIFTDGFCPNIIDTVTIEFLSAPLVSVGDYATCDGVPTTLVPVVSNSSIYDVVWNTGATSLSINVVSGGEYIVVVSNDCGVSVDTAFVEILNCTLIIPNIITPNGDGINDTFYIENIDNHPGVLLQIFNRWGNLVWEASPYQNNWGGKDKQGDNLSDGTYFFVLTSDKLENAITGTVNIAR
ncbi:MAG: gliding motility-associated C-terminal domain-containing protein [Flavobacteriales bacterium]